MALNDVRSAFLPYCIKQVEPGWFVILNREYKPLGQTTHKPADYRDHMVRIRGLGPERAKRLSAKGDSDITTIYLYNDGCIPTRSTDAEERYFKRLANLYRLKIGEEN